MSLYHRLQHQTRTSIRPAPTTPEDSCEPTLPALFSARPATSGPKYQPGSHQLSFLVRPAPVILISRLVPTDPAFRLASRVSGSRFILVPSWPYPFSKAKNKNKNKGNIIILFFIPSSHFLHFMPLITLSP